MFQTSLRNSRSLYQAHRYIYKQKYDDKTLLLDDVELKGPIDMFDENGKRFERRFYFHDGQVYKVVGPEATSFAQEQVVYQADELRHAFDWIIRNPKE